MIPEIISVIENAVAMAGFEVMGGTKSSLVIRNKKSDADYVVRVEEEGWD